MRANKIKIQLARAKACMGVMDISVKAGLPVATVKNVLCGRSVRPETIGKVAKALAVDPIEIIDLEVS